MAIRNIMASMAADHIDFLFSNSILYKNGEQKRKWLTLILNQITRTFGLN
jgi:hypothetical protein